MAGHLGRTASKLRTQNQGQHVYVRDFGTTFTDTQRESNASLLLIIRHFMTLSTSLVGPSMQPAGTLTTAGSTGGQIRQIEHSIVWVFSDRVLEYTYELARCDRKHPCTHRRMLQGTRPQILPCR